MEPDRSVPIDLDLKDADGVIVTNATVRWESPDCIGCVPEEKAKILEGQLRQMVCPGTHKLFIEKEGYRIVRSVITAEPGTLQQVDVLMKPTKIKMEAKQIFILEKVYFDFDKDTIQERSFELLDEVADTIIANPQSVGSRCPVTPTTRATTPTTWTCRNAARRRCVPTSSARACARVGWSPRGMSAEDEPGEGAIVENPRLGCQPVPTSGALSSSARSLRCASKSARRVASSGQPGRVARAAW
jgi:hypothetical protein